MSDEKIQEVDKRLAVLETQMASLDKSFERMAGKVEAAQTRLFWLVFAGIGGAFINFVVNGGLNIAG